MGSYRDLKDTFLSRVEGEILAFAESFAEPLIVVSSQGTITHCNRSLLRQLGYTEAEIIGMPFDQVFLDFDLENCKELQKSDTSRHAIRMDGTIAHKNRKPINAELTFFMFHIGDSSQTSIAAVMCRLESQASDEKCSAGYPARSFALSRAAAPNKKILGNSNAINCTRNMIGLVGETDSSVLITGESGTGKELAAEEIHATSRRAGHPLVKINCAALPETLLESELFGYMKGSFTGAVKDSFGLFKAADEGTLFLDEIGDIAAEGQSKLLHALERREFYRIGDSTPIKVNVRIIAATNQNLPERIQRRLFREDLYYRLNVIEIKMPPLRKRTEDIPPLIEHFLDMLNAKLKKKVRTVSDEVMSFFSDYKWPGNVRELAHALEHACILCQEGVIHMHHLPPELQNKASFADRLPVDCTMPQAEILRNVLSKTGGNKARAARILGINRKTLYRNLKKYHINS